MRFNIGDRVRFQVRSDGWPRWDYDDDFNINGNECEWAEGKVIELDFNNFILVEYPRNGRNDVWEWPTEGHNRYSPDQWNRPGYLQKSYPMVEHLHKFENGQTIHYTVPHVACQANIVTAVETIFYTSVSLPSNIDGYRNLIQEVINRTIMNCRQCKDQIGIE